MKTSELTGMALDWAVAKCEGVVTELIFDGITHGFKLNGNLKVLAKGWDSMSWHPSTDWSQGGPIIEREKIDLDHSTNDGVTTGYRVVNGVEEEYALTVLEVVVWTAFKNYGRHIQNGPTPLIAAMRCLIASKLGDEIDVPEELLK